jgi:hypothetical protein
MMKALERTLSIVRNTKDYTIAFCELKRRMGCDDLIFLLDAFEQSLSEMSPLDRCTSTTKVAIQIGSRVYFGIDGSCKWEGFRILTQALYSVNPHDPENKTCLKDW